MRSSRFVCLAAVAAACPAPAADRAAYLDAVRLTDAHVGWVLI